MIQKIWLVTGISSGLGKSLAQAIIDSGDFVVGTMRQQSQVDDFNREFEGKAQAMVLDLNDENATAHLVKKVIEEYTRIDVLVNNAGVGIIGAIEEYSLEEVRDVFETNFFSTLRLTQLVLPHMREKQSGHIVQISSHGGLKAFAGFGIYNASKFALEGFSEALAQEVAPLGIDVSLVLPGPFRTNFASSNLKEAVKRITDYDATAGAFREKLKGVHGKQEGDPDKAAHAILDLVNAENPTLRMPLGITALKTIQMKIDSVQSDLDYHRDTAANAVFSS